MIWMGSYPSRLYIYLGRYRRDILSSGCRAEGLELNGKVHIHASMEANHTYRSPEPKARSIDKREEVLECRSLQPLHTSTWTSIGSEA
jgi:hypothetical protein